MNSGGESFMNPRSVFVAAFGLAAALTPAYSRGEGEVSPPPPVPATQLPGSARVAPDPPAGWIPANAPQSTEATATSSPQSISVPYAAPPAAVPQTFTLQVQVVPVPAPVSVQAMSVSASP